MDRAEWFALGGLGAGAVALILSDNETVRTQFGRWFTWRNVQVLPGKPSIPTSISQAELDTLRSLATGKTVAEIGAAYGYSTVVMGLVATKVYSVDPHTQLSDTYASLVANINAYGLTNVEVVQAFSQDFCLWIPPGTLQVLFIDGDHSYAGTLHDLMCGKAAVSAGGTIAVHDYARLDQVKAACDDWAGRPPDSIVDSLALYALP